LGPDPPPGEIINFIEKSRFLPFWGPSIEPEKPSPKSASTANPPQKVDFIAFLLKIYSLNGLASFSTLFWSLAYCLPLPFFGTLGIGYSEFFWFCNSFVVLIQLLIFVCLLFVFVRRSPNRKQTVGPQKGAFTGAIAGNSSLRNTTMGLFYRDPIDQTQTGVPRPPTDQAQYTGTV
jgi:hypothetical protein